MVVQNTRDEIISYSKLRTFIGMLGIGLPILVWLGCLCGNGINGSLQFSISHYYYSKMHIVFVGTLCLLAGFFVSYKGKSNAESRVSNLAGIFAFGIAAFPTSIDGYIYNEGQMNLYIFLRNPVSNPLGMIHFISAGLLFTCFIIFCLHFFQKPDNPADIGTLKFNRRKMIYKLCGWIILVSVLLIAFFSKFEQYRQGIFKYSTFIFETTALWAFGTAWLVKGSRTLEHVPIVEKMVHLVR